MDESELFSDSILDFVRVEDEFEEFFAGLASIRYLPCHVRKRLYQSLVLPHLDCAVAWHSCGVAMSDQIEKIRYVCDLAPTTLHQ